MNESRERYTPTQILCGLKIAWAEFTATDEPFDADTSIVQYMRANGTWANCDLGEIFEELSELFGFKCSKEEWHNFFGCDVPDPADWEREVSPRLTFGSLSVFIADKVEGISIAPAIVLGRTCPAAGAFRGMEQLAQNITKRPVRFSPSTRIVDVLRGESLDRYWTRLRWISENRISELPSGWRNAVRNSVDLGCVSIMAGFVLAFFLLDMTFLIAALSVSVAIVALAMLGRRTVNPLSPDFVTFRDLAMCIADSKAGKKETAAGQSG